MEQGGSRPVRRRWIVVPALGLLLGGLLAVPVLQRDQVARRGQSVDVTLSVSHVASAEPDPVQVLPMVPPTLTGDLPAPFERLQNNPIPSFVRSGPPSTGRMAISIDDFFGAAGTEKLRLVLDIADSRHVHLTFFPTGGSLEDAIASGQQEVWRRAVRSGHEIGNHTYTHSNLLRLTDQQIRDELSTTQNLLNKLLGPEFSYQMRLLRPPGGAGGMEANGNPRIMRVLTELGYTMVMWGIDSNYTTGFDSYVNKIAGPGTTSGSIALLHFATFSPANIATTIDRVRAERHLEPVTVSELFGP